MSKKATHDRWGEVEVLEGPLTVNGKPYYWVVRDSESAPISALAEYLTFPPHEEYWVNHYPRDTVNIANTDHPTLESAQKNAQTRLMTHRTRHWQQELDGEWQVEVVSDE